VSAVALYIAVDLGAGSGRVFTGALGPGGLELDQVTRFRYPAREVDGHLRWDFSAILREIREVQRRKIELAGGDPDQFEGGISGSAVQEGSGASITWDPNESDEE